MNKKNMVKKTAALLMGLALTVGATGCNFVVKDTAADYAQEIAKVDISDRLEKDDMKEIVGMLPSSITKSDLVSYFMSIGYQYVQNYGYSYKDTFNMLLDALINREVMVQYAVAYYLEKGDGVTAAGCKAYVENETAKAEGKEKELLKAHPEVLTLKYFLTKNGTETEDYDRTVYTLKSSLNSSLDSMEANYIEAEEEEHNHGSRTTPTGVSTEKEDYYTNDYDVYTGRNTLDSCGKYEKVEGSTTVTRQKAYNAFLANLQSYNLIKKGEDMKDITLLDYYYVELASSLGQALISKYFDDLESTALAMLDTDDGAYVSGKYEELYNQQLDDYQNDTSAFATAMDSVSDTSFLLYGLQDYGFVYNILLPFSTSQTIEYKTAQNNSANSQTDLYNIRRDILSNIKGKDLRSEWIDEHDHANHAYKAEDGKWYFFEENFTNGERYEKIDHYLNLIPFNGTVDEETMEAKSNEVTVDQVLDQYLAYARSLGLTVEEATPVNELGQGYSDVKVSYNKAKKDVEGEYVLDENGNYKYTKEVDYSNFVYRAGKVNVEANPGNYFKADTDLYKLLSYANELMFAYSTDTGCLNKYMGYSVSPYTTNYMKEFEYAAQKAVEGGVGSYVVCPTDYGWHIIITTFVYGEDGDVYGGYKHAEKDVEGTFSYFFYESLKESVVNNYTTEIQNGVLKEYNTDACVTKYPSRYQDLLDMDN